MEQYLKLAKLILDKGIKKADRTGVGTISYFGTQTRYNLNYGLPILTTKQVNFKAILHELLWFIRGDTNIKYLVDNGVNIWNQWPYEVYKDSSTYQNESLSEFIEKIKLDPKFAKLHGNLGPVYGKQWRNFNGVDQLEDVIRSLRANPDSRRLIVSAWNPKEVKQMLLPPCHTLFQFYVSQNQLSCQLYQRSADVFLGVPFNITSYSLLTMLIAHHIGFKLGEFIHTTGDTHIYLNHLNQIKLQLTRKPLPLPNLKIKVKRSKITDYQFDDFELVNYKHDLPIRGEVAV